MKLVRRIWWSVKAWARKRLGDAGSFADPRYSTAIDRMLWGHRRPR